MSIFEERRERMVRMLIEMNVLKSPSVIRSMRIVRRENFVPPSLREYAYVDSPLPIGWDQTISAPHMCAMMNEALDLKVGHKVLEIGAGSGYHASLIGEIVAPSNVDPSLWGHVYTVEIIPELVEFARRNIEREGYSDRVTVICADGSKGYPEHAPYNRIFVTASAPDIPKPLIDQLVVDGLLVIPVGDPYFSQDLILVRKRPDGKIERKSICPVRFVPLRGECGWKY